MEIDLAALRAAATEEEFTAELVDLCADTAPRRFALCAVYGEREDGEVVAWGVAGLDRTTLLWPDGSRLGEFSSLRAALRLFGRLGPTRLIWVDPEPDENSLAGAGVNT